jgi:hypothetical protein
VRSCWSSEISVLWDDSSHSFLENRLITAVGGSDFD